MVTVSDFNRGIAGGNTGARSSNSSNNDPSGGRRQAYEDMASVGIRGVSGRTTDDSDGKGSFDRGEKAREIQLDYLADRDRAFILLMKISYLILVVSQMCLQRDY